MFQHLRIRENSDLALEETDLLNVGRINVLCGKNNSGKSTILTTISGDTKFSAGISIGDDEIEQIKSAYKGLRLRSQWTGSAPSPEQFKGLYETAVDSVFCRGRIYFADDKEALLEELSHFFDGLVKKPAYELNRKELESTLNRLGTFDLPSRVLLPPKRIIESEEFFQHFSNVQNNGEKLLNRLLFAKNQAESSAEIKNYHYLKTVFSEIASGFTFDVNTAATRNVNPSQYLVRLNFSFESSGTWIDASDCGLGLRDLLLILYYALNPDFDVILIEEPENHIHPEMQRRLLRFLSEETEKQYFITTHSNVFLNSTYVDRVFFTEYKNSKIKVADATSKAKILHSLGYSVTDNLVSDLIVLVEGSGDKDFLEEFFSKFGLDAKYNIKIWILGGDEMVNQDLSVFAQSYELVALVDKDSEGSEKRKARMEFEKNCAEYNIPVTILDRYSIESYFSIHALNKTFNKYDRKLPEIDGLNDEDLQTKIKDKPVWKRIADTSERQREIKKMFKRKIREIGKEMTLEDIEGTDLKAFLDHVQELLKVR